MSTTAGLLRVTSLALAGVLALAPAALAKDFTFSQKANDRLAKKMQLPVYFALPPSARGDIPGNIDTTDILVDFKHPEATTADLGLRLVVAKRAGMAARLAKSGLIQTGDILLTFRTEWGGAGAYPNVQMGISHTGMAYVKNGIVHNIDNPLNEEYLGAGLRADLTSEHYRTLDYMHIIRPRAMTAEQRNNLATWANRLNASAGRVYPSQISFNQDYNAPKYKSGKPVEFVKHLAQIGLGKNPPGNVDMYCSEFVWSLLSLRDCDPAKVGADFDGSGIPACVKEPMKPMVATGEFAFKRDNKSNAGLADGPLMVINALKPPAEERKKLLASVFVQTPGSLTKLSTGHKAVAEQMQPKFEPLSRYYAGAGGGIFENLKARLISKAFIREIPENYSPTSFLINTLLPKDSTYRRMDYIATIVIE